mmetsp:Transcript_42689/g.69615  ORF Transcript_42689/g.69615 Transcript_42689/m.69615 type:complete len:235 (+) Transcript_42689:1391-2095(+)
MPALSGMLITTGMGMLNPAEFKHCYEVQKIDAVPFAATIGGMLSFGLAEGIGIGCATALALNFRNWNPVAKTTTSMMEAVEAPEVFYKMAEIQKASKPSEAASSRLQTHQVQMYHTSCGQGLEMDRSKSAIWQLNGPINFLSMFEIDDLARDIQDRLAAEEGPLDAVVLDMHGVTSLEFTGVEELVNRLVAVADVSGAAIRMVNCSDAVQKAFDQCDPAQQIPRFSVLSAAAPV